MDKRVHLWSTWRSVAALGSISLLGAIAVLLFGLPAAPGVPVALADNGPHVTSINSGSAGIAADSCAGCHRAHTAQGPLLISAEDDVALCFTCHGSGSTGATTNVEDGVVAAASQGLLGGGFSYALMDTDWSTPATSRPVSSAHMIDGTSPATMWGSGAINSGAGTTISLTCTNCHNPHGSGTYRILRPIPTDSGATTGVSVPDEAVPVYGVTSAQNRYFGQVYFGGDVNRQNELDRWCSTCHTRYDAVGPGAGHTNSGDAIYSYRHTTRYSGFINCQLCHDPNDFSAPDPLDVNGAIAHRPLCQNCHVAHGTAATMGTISGDVDWPDGATSPSGDSRSSLLRLDNRGVCSACHDPTR